MDIMAEAAAAVSSSVSNQSKASNILFVNLEIIKSEDHFKGSGDSFSWLDYDENKDAVYCHTCRQAEPEKKLHSVTCKEAAFASIGFSHWKDATARFCNHEKVHAIQLLLTALFLVLGEVLGRCFLKRMRLNILRLEF